MGTCTPDVHEQIKADDSLWETATEPPRGHNEKPVVAHRDRWWAVANCTRCKSTLMRPTVVHLAQR